MFEPTSFPRSTMVVPLLAPLWEDLHFLKSGFVYYRQANDTETLARVRSMIADVNPGLSEFQPTLAVIVTWFEAKRVADSSLFAVS